MCSKAFLNLHWPEYFLVWPVVRIRQRTKKKVENVTNKTKTGDE